MLKEFFLSSINISGIVTDSVPAVGEKRQEFLKLIQDNEIASSNAYLMKCHCIAHQEILYVQSLKCVRDGLVG